MYVDSAELTFFLFFFSLLSVEVVWKAGKKDVDMMTLPFRNAWNI